MREKDLTNHALARPHCARRSTPIRLRALHRRGGLAECGFVMTDLQAARIAGALFVAATAPVSISMTFLASVLDSLDFLALAAGHPGRVSAGVLLELVSHVTLVGIAVALYPILRRHSERLAPGYLSAQSIQATVFGWLPRTS